MLYLEGSVTPEVFIITLQEVYETGESNATLRSDRLLLTHVVKGKHRQSSTRQQSKYTNTQSYDGQLEKLGEPLADKYEL